MNLGTSQTKVVLPLMDLASCHFTRDIFLLTFNDCGRFAHFSTVQVLLLAEETTYIQFVEILHCKLSIIGKQLPPFPHKVPDLNHRLQRSEASVLPLCHNGPSKLVLYIIINSQGHIGTGLSICTCESQTHAKVVAYD